MRVKERGCVENTFAGSLYGHQGRGRIYDRNGFNVENKFDFSNYFLHC